jgi:hypothetical protein
MVRTINGYFETLTRGQENEAMPGRPGSLAKHPSFGDWLPQSFILYPQKEELPAATTRTLAEHVQEERRRLAKTRDERAIFLQTYVCALSAVLLDYSHVDMSQAV